VDTAEAVVLEQRLRGCLELALFPNPGHGQFTLRVEGTSQVYNVPITDMLGHVVRRIEGTGSMDVPDVPVEGNGFAQKVLVVP